MARGHAISIYATTGLCVDRKEPVPGLKESAWKCYSGLAPADEPPRYRRLGIMGLKRTSAVSWVFLLALLPWRSALAQTTVNPAISFIGDMRLTGLHNAPAEVGENKFVFNFNELEIAAGSALNPYARADVTLGISKSGVDIEEAFATLLRGLPLNLQVKAGQFRVDFGKLNTQHTHQWSWIERPLMLQRFFGPDGLDAAGVNISSMVGVGRSALTFSGNAFTGGSYWGDPQAENFHNLTASGRVSLFTPLTSHANIECGLSGLTTRLGAAPGGQSTMGDLDFKYKWKPDMYRSVVLVVEPMIGSKLVAPEGGGTGAPVRVTVHGLFSSLDVQFRRQYNAGVFLDYAQTPTLEKPGQAGFGVFAGFSLVEETYRLGLLVRRDQGSALVRPYQTVILQLLWSLGPHKPHQF